jgi:hypothetical protein
VLDGSKTTTSGLLQYYEIDGEPLPVAGSRAAVIDSAGRRVAVIEVTGVRISRLGDVDVRHARDEGEGDDSVASWRAGHERFWHGTDRIQPFTAPVRTPLVKWRCRNGYTIRIGTIETTRMAIWIAACGGSCSVPSSAPPIAVLFTT